MFPLETPILICDDSEIMLKNVKSSLNSLGYKNVLEASDGDQGFLKLTMAAKTLSPVGLIISDWNMPNLNGVDFLIKIRDMRDYATLPFILLTSQNEMNQVISAAVSGVDAYIIKPVEADKLKANMSKVWKKFAKK